MTPTQNTTPTSAVILDRIESLRCDVAKLQATVEIQSQATEKFILDYTREHTRLEAEVKRVDEKADRAHQRVDVLSKGAWAIAVPVILMMIGYLFQLITQ